MIKFTISINWEEFVKLEKESDITNLRELHYKKIESRGPGIYGLCSDGIYRILSSDEINQCAKIQNEFWQLP